MMDEGADLSFSRELDRPADVEKIELTLDN